MAKRIARKPGWTANPTPTRESSELSPPDERQIISEAEWIDIIETPADLNQVRAQVNNMIGNTAVRMVRNTIEQVNQGHSQALKMLLEMAGLSQLAIADDEPEQDSLAKVLLKRLGLPDRSSSASRRPVVNAVE